MTDGCEDIYTVLCAVLRERNLGQGRERGYVRGSCRKPLFRGAILHITIALMHLTRL
jgi:hypothetical protein